MIEMLMQFALALFATLGFSIIFRVPLKHIPVCIVIGALGWISYICIIHYLSSPIIGCFVASCVVGLLSTAASHICKDAATIFVIPGILCLVPGSRIFQTMDALLNHNISQSTQIGLQLLLMAGAIALGLLVVGASIGMIRKIIKSAGKIQLFR